MIEILIDAAVPLVRPDRVMTLAMSRSAAIFRRVVVGAMRYSFTASAETFMLRPVTCRSLLCHAVEQKLDAEACCPLTEKPSPRAVALSELTFGCSTSGV